MNDNKCPVCGLEMEDSGCIGPYCANAACPVSDDALLWSQDAEGNWSRPAPARLQLPPSNDAMREALRLAVMVRNANEVKLTFKDAEAAHEMFNLLLRFN